MNERSFIVKSSSESIVFVHVAAGEIPPSISAERSLRVVLSVLRCSRQPRRPPPHPKALVAAVYATTLYPMLLPQDDVIKSAWAALAI
jgi:hypothetical protein